MLVGICTPGIHIPTPACILLKTRDEPMLFSVCDLLIKILLAHIANPVKHFCLTERQAKTNTQTKARKKITQHTGYNSTSIQQAQTHYALNETTHSGIHGSILISGMNRQTDRLAGTTDCVTEVMQKTGLAGALREDED